MENVSLMEYFLFSTFLALCTLVGLYFGWRDRNVHSKESYFVGNRRMNVIAVSLSAFVSNFSSIGYMILPNDTYFRGPGMWFAVLIAVIAECISIAVVFVPVIHRLKIINIYNYLEMRFSATVKYIAVVVQIFFLLFYMAISIYAASLAVATLFGMDVNLAVAIVGGICVFYTVIGGVKAVVWTDCLQVRKHCMKCLA